MCKLNDDALATKSAAQPLSTEELLLQATARAIDVALQRDDSRYDPDHWNPAEGGNRTADDYWGEP